MNSSTYYFRRKYVHANGTRLHDRRHFNEGELWYHELTGCRYQLHKLTLLVLYYGCKVWMNETYLVWLKLNIFVTFVADFEISVSCARHLSNFYGKCSSQITTSSSTSSVSITSVTCFCSRSDPADLVLLICLWIPVVLELWLNKIQQNFLGTLSGWITLHIIHTKVHIWQYVKPYPLSDTAT